MTAIAGSSRCCSAKKTQLWWDLPARESLELNAKIYGISDNGDARSHRQRNDRTAGRVCSDIKLNVAVRELSLGERMKDGADCVIAASSENPVTSTKPTIGLDVVSQKTVREFLREYNAKHKTTILLTSHYMTDIQELCKRVVIIDKGVISFDGQLSDVVDRFADFKLITIQFEGTATYSAEAVAKYGELVEHTPGTLTLKVKRDRASFCPVCKALLDEIPVSDIDIQEVPIAEDVIRKIFAR